MKRGKRERERGCNISAVIKLRAMFRVGESKKNSRIKMPRDKLRNGSKEKKNEKKNPKTKAYFVRAF